MKKKCFSSVLCCLLALFCLFSGCERKSPLLVHADDVGDLKTDYAAIDLIHHFGYSIENGEGETLSRVPETTSHEDGKPDEGDKDIVGGTMEYSKEATAGYTRSGGRWRTYQVPFSQTFTVNNNISQAYVDMGVISEKDVRKLDIESRVSFYTEDSTIEQLTRGYWSKAVHHCNNVVELYGDLSEFGVCFSISEGVKFGEPWPFIGQKAAYIIRGTGKDHVVIALVDGKIQAEGMVGNYTVTWKREHESWNTRQEYDENGKLLHTERGYLPEEFNVFRPTMTIG